MRNRHPKRSVMGQKEKSMKQITEAVQFESELEFAIRPFREKGLKYIVVRCDGGYALFDPKAVEAKK